MLLVYWTNDILYYYISYVTSLNPKIMKDNFITVVFFDPIILWFYKVKNAKKYCLQYETIV